MANTIVLPYPTIPRTCKRHQWRRYTTTAMTINKTSKHSSSYIVHNSAPNLPDIVNDCHNRRNDVIILNAEMKSMCKEIAHSLRIVADQVDKKYCQVSLTDIIYFLFCNYKMLFDYLGW